ncbi:MAG: DUF4157 domain-containing protein [Desulfobulbus oligotrophicus]|jgi:hypothetical protein|nr:DUF4157 domain-containing protein [Desulfobulbus oligotrophicus]
MKETAKAPPATSRQPQPTGTRQPFFTPEQRSGFFATVPVQPKLKIGKRGDIYEQEAETMADQVVNRADSPASSVNDNQEERLSRRDLQTQGDAHIHRQPFFESEADDGEPVQRFHREVEEGDKVFRSEDDLPVGMSRGEAIVAIARSKLGKVKAKQPEGSDGGRPLRYGYDLLLEIFQLSAPGVWGDDVVKYIGPGLPSWCGIFATYCIKKAGIDIGNWQMGKGVAAYGTLKPTDSPQPGDIGYIDQPYQHHCIISRVEGDSIESIDGNSGLFSEITENKRSRTAYTGFFTAQHTTAAVQKKEQDEGSAENTPDLESSLQAQKGRGEPLDNTTRGTMETSFGTEFGGVRIHTDNEAARLSNTLNAQAFTHGNDIYFNEGTYNPETSAGKHLLAHELTHTLQQRDGLQPMVNRAANPGSSKEPAINFSDKTITIKKLYLPKLKGRNKNLIGTAVTRNRNYKRKDSYKDTATSSSKAQDVVWKTGVEPKVTTEVEKLTKKAADSMAYDASANAYYLKWGSLNLIGSKETIVKNALVPLWNKTGKASAYDVDHVKELQLGGENSLDNMELLNFSANRASGSAVKRTIEIAVNTFLASEEAKKQAADAGKKLPSLKTAKTTYDITFSSVAYDDAKANFSKGALGDDYWSKKDIVDNAAHLKQFKPMTTSQIAAAKGTENDPIIYTSEAGGTGLRKADLEKIKGIAVSKFTFPLAPTGEKAGDIELTITPPSVVNGDIKVPIPIYKMDGIVFGGHMPRRGSKKGQGGLEKILSKLQINGLSPAELDMVDFVPGIGLVVRGRIQPTLDILEGVELDFFLEGDSFGISKTITAGEFKLPPPFKINAALLTIGAGNKGIFVEGDVLFEISKLGTGMISGLGKSNGDFGIKGRFDFDPKLFKQGAASIEVEYNNKQGWAAKGELQIGKGTVRGIDSAKIAVAYANRQLTANGTAQVALRGVDEVTLAIRFGEEVSEIEGTIKIGKLPGVKEGSGQLKLIKTGDDYDFSGAGKITPDIPGLSTQVDFEFHNNIFLVDARVAYDKNRLKGTLNLGITNRAIDAAGNPTGEALPDYKVYGKSTLELMITDKLVVNAGVNLLENGEIEVTGGIRLPQRFEVVPTLLSVANKPLITVPPIHIPLFGIPLGITTIGVEAVISPRLTASVQIGPGSLVNVGAEITYNPAHPETMSITGGADFEFVAEAGITAGVDFGLSASVAVAALTGGIDLSAFIKAAAKQPVFHTALSYSPASGFELDGLVNAKVAAVLGFSGDLFVRASAGVWPAEISKTWRWPIFKKEVDTGLEIGFEFPFAYKDNKADVSFENLRFTYPSLDDLTGKVREKIVDPLVHEF